MFTVDAGIIAEIIGVVLTLSIALFTGLWAYTRFVLERSLLPPIQFHCDCNRVGSQDNQTVLEILLYIHNLGSSTLVANGVRVDVRYLVGDDRLKLFPQSDNKKFGRLDFPHSVRSGVRDPEKPRGFPLVNNRTFVRPGVNQSYTFVTTVPASATYVLVFGMLKYAQDTTRFQNIMLKLGRYFGLIVYSLQELREDHTCEKIFDVKPPTAQARSIPS